MMVMRISTENDLLKQDIERLQKENEILSLGRGTMNFSSALTKKLQEELAQSEAYKHQLIKENGRYREHIVGLERALQNIVNSEVLSCVVDNSYYADAIKALKGGDL